MSNVRAPIKVDQLGIGEILKQYKLKVPPHQREYSWKANTHVLTLFQDLAKAISDGEPVYFLGTIVTIPYATGRLEVIDGQQRLATITVLLCQMRRYLLDKEKLIADDIKGFITYPDREKRAVLPRMSLNLADNAYFISMLSDDQAQPLPEAKVKSHRLIAAAFEKAAEYVKVIVAGQAPTEHGDILNKWITFIENKAEVILLQIPSGANAYKMFETLNDRGLKTTQADLVKNYLFSQAGDERLAEAQSSWSRMRGALEVIQPADDDEDKEDITVTFFRHALMSIQGFLRKGAVFEAVQKLGKGQSSMAFLIQIERLAVVYVATFSRDHERWAKYPDAMRDAIWTVNFFDIHPFRPVLLAVADKFPPKEALRAFRFFVSLGVRLFIAASTRSGVVEETLARAANKVFLGSISNTSALKSELSEITPSDEQFRQAFEIASVSKGSLARYYLRTIEKVAKNQPDPYYTLSDDKEAITLEHILPQQPGNNWPQFSLEEAELYYKRLGNMVLLLSKNNNDLKNGGWKSKRPSFQNHPYALTAQVYLASDWTPDVINERQRGLAKFAIKAWPV